MGFRQAIVADLDVIERGYIEHFAHEKKYGAYSINTRQKVYVFSEYISKLLHSRRKCTIRPVALFIFKD